LLVQEPPIDRRGRKEREQGAPGVACGWVSSGTNPPPWRNGSGEGAGAGAGGVRSG
jgi:hypothetical protein